MKTQKMVRREPINKELKDGKTAEIIMVFLGLLLETISILKPKMLFYCDLHLPSCQEWQREIVGNSKPSMLYIYVCVCVCVCVCDKGWSGCINFYHCIDYHHLWMSWSCYLKPEWNLGGTLLKLRCCQTQDKLSYECIM